MTLAVAEPRDQAAGVAGRQRAQVGRRVVRPQALDASTVEIGTCN